MIENLITYYLNLNRIGAYENNNIQIQNDDQEFGYNKQMIDEATGILSNYIYKYINVEIVNVMLRFLCNQFD